MARFGLIGAGGRLIPWQIVSKSVEIPVRCKA
jgi:hypothetical protein